MRCLSSRGWACGDPTVSNMVLLIDLDPQASLTCSLVRPDQWHEELAAAKTIRRWYHSLPFGGAPNLSSLSSLPRR